MIGQNNIQGEIFAISDARRLVSFAAASHLGRISMSSLNRDSQCGSSFPEIGLLSNTCSGTAQSSLEFTHIFGQLQGDASITSSAGDVQPAVANTNPADASYPLWSAVAGYPSGYMVVEDGQDYQAKWYNAGDDPHAQVQYFVADAVEPAGTGTARGGLRRSSSSRRPSPTRTGRSVPGTGPGARCSMRACPTRPNGTTRGSPR